MRARFLEAEPILGNRYAEGCLRGLAAAPSTQLAYCVTCRQRSSTGEIILAGGAPA